MTIFAKLIDSRNKKEYRGTLTTKLIEVGKPVRILFPDGKNEFYVTPLRGFLSLGKRYWLTDTNGIRFRLILSHDLRG